MELHTSLQPLDVDDGPRERRSFESTRSNKPNASRDSAHSSFTLYSESTMSVSTAALITVDAASGADDLMQSDGGKLTLPQATIVLFCTAFGAGIALVGWYPTLVGWMGYVVVLVLVGTTAFLVEKAMMATAREARATTFSELCASLPAWAKLLSECSQIVWGFTLVGLYTQFVYGFINKQILDDRFAYSGFNALPLYACVGAAVFMATTPTNFSGTVAKILTKINLSATWIVIFLAIFKGCQRIATVPIEERVKKVLLFDSSKLFDVVVLIAGSMLQVPSVPQLNFEIIPEKRERAGWVVTGTVAAIQAVIFCAVGLLGYFALGDSIGSDGDVFKAYAEKAQLENREDIVVTVIQACVAVLMYLSTPLVSLPAKSQLWALIGECRSLEANCRFAEAPLGARIGINLAMTVFGTAVPMFLGPEKFMVLLTIVAGVAANWLNLFLPSFVIFLVNVRPSYSRGGRWRAAAATVTWTFVLASAAVISSGFKIYRIFVPASEVLSTTSTTSITVSVAPA